MSPLPSRGWGTAAGRRFSPCRYSARSRSPLRRRWSSAVVDHQRGGSCMPDWQVPGYTELTRLGSGSFGTVMLARHDATGLLVAIKYLRPDLLADEEAAARFRREAQVLASLHDQNVVRLYEFVESASGAAIVMELVDGVTLRAILARNGTTTP